MACGWKAPVKPCIQACMTLAAPVSIVLNGPRLGGENPDKKSAINVAISNTTGNMNRFAPANKPLPIAAAILAAPLMNCCAPSTRNVPN